MEDSKIIDLYWERNEKAISATGQKYGSYCYGSRISPSGK